MKNFQPKFIISVADGNNFYKTNKPLVAIAGKSNVGKSSLINMLAGNGKLARTSAEPGRTRLINYFDFGDFTLADLPGYGYAKVSKEEKDKWGRLMDEFLSTEKIDLVISLVDIRHDPTEDDLIMINYLYHYSIPFIIVATKADKLAKTKIKPALSNIASKLKVGIDNVISSSAEANIGKSAIMQEIAKMVK